MVSLFAGSASLLGFLFCYLLPAYNSFKALRSGSRKAVIKLLMHWTVVSLFAGVEVFADVLIGWLPFYNFSKFMFILWLTLPQTQGAVVVYRYVIHTRFLQHEAKIDRLLSHAESAAWDYAHYLRARAIQYGKRLLVASLDQGQHLLRSQMQDPAALATSVTQLVAQLHIAAHSAVGTATGAVVAPAISPVEPSSTAAEPAAGVDMSQHVDGADEQLTDEIEQLVEDNDDSFDAAYVDVDEEELRVPGSSPHLLLRRHPATPAAASRSPRTLQLRTSARRKSNAKLRSPPQTAPPARPAKTNAADCDAPFTDDDIAEELAQSRKSWTALLSPIAPASPASPAPVAPADENSLAPATALPTKAAKPGRAHVAAPPGVPIKRVFAASSRANSPPVLKPAVTKTANITTGPRWPTVTTRPRV